MRRWLSIRSRWKRALTVFAGPAFNFLLTIAVFAVIFAIYGKFVSEPVVSEVRPESPAPPPASSRRPLRQRRRNPGRSFADVQRLVSGRAGDEIQFVLSRDGKEVAVKATPELMEQTDARKRRQDRRDRGGQHAGDRAVAVVTFTPAGALTEAVVETGHIIVRTGQF